MSDTPTKMDDGGGEAVSEQACKWCALEMPMVSWGGPYHAGSPPPGGDLRCTATPSPSGKVEQEIRALVRQTWVATDIRKFFPEEMVEPAFGRQETAFREWLASYESEVAERVRAEERERCARKAYETMMALGLEPATRARVAAALRAGEG